MTDATRDDAVVPWPIAVPQSELDDLHARIDRTRWPEAEPAPGGWVQGAPLAKVRELVDYWRHAYDWRRCEAMLNDFGSFRTVIDGLGFHVIHARSPVADAKPMLITHGWPGSVVEFARIIGPLTDPAAYGGDPKDAFHVVAPSLPGYGFSDKPTETGWGVERIAKAWEELMRRLGYTAWVAQGGDWGAAVTTQLGHIRAQGLEAIHLNMPSFVPERDDPNPGPEETRALERNRAHRHEHTGYSRIQSTKPQTLGYALVDSPVGQAAWIYEKMHAWTDNDGDPESVVSKDEMLDNIMMYWLPGAGGSSARLYWESFRRRPPQVDIPTMATVFPREIVPAPRSWCEKVYTDIRRWTEVEKGGHFAAFEQPEIFVREVRDAFRPFR